MRFELREIRDMNPLWIVEPLGFDALKTQNFNAPQYSIIYFNFRLLDHQLDEIKPIAKVLMRKFKARKGSPLRELITRYPSFIPEYITSS